MARAHLIVAVLVLVSIGLVNSALGARSQARTDFLRNHQDRYIVVMKEGAKGDDHARLVNKIAVASSDKLRTQAIVPRHFRFGSFSAFATSLDQSALQTIVQDPAVHFVERDGLVRAYGDNDLCIKQKQATWGLNRVTERKPLMNGDFIYEEEYGSNVTVYVVDTGIYTEHEEFEGRASWGANLISHEPELKDGNGHGTHCSGTIGGKTYGISRSVQLVAVRVLDSEGEGTYAEVIAGIEWLTRDALAKKTPAVASMSLGGPKNKALDTAIQKAIEAGVIFVVAAGNENSDACQSSPANIPPAITVGATELAHNGIQDTDKRAYYSNYGTCVDIFAPGSYITSAWIGTPTSTKTISGTSMATPHVAGAVASYLTTNPTATPAQVKAYLTNEATPDMIQLACSSSSSVCSKSPNKLLYVPCGDESLQSQAKKSGHSADFDGAVAHDVVMQIVQRKDDSAASRSIFDAFKCRACKWAATRLQQELICRPDGALQHCGDYIFSGLCSVVSKTLCSENCLGQDCAQLLCEDIDMCERQF